MITIRRFDPLRIGLFLYAALLAVPLRYFAIEPGLDPSWAFALKWFHAQGLKFGQDLAFTWGPLGHLAIAMDVNGGLTAAAAAQITGWALYLAILAYVAFTKRVPLWRLAAFTVLTYAGVRMFHSFGYAGFDFFLSWLVLLLIGCSSATDRWWLPWGVAVVLASLLMLTKLSTGIAAVSAVVSYPLGALLLDRRRALRMGALAVAGLPLVFVLGYCLHNPSLSSMMRYIHAGLEISSEHSTILSLPGQPLTLYLALALLACYSVLTLVLLRARNAAFPLALAMAGPLFLEFKHSFIREPGHVEMLFLFAPLLAAILALFVITTGWSRHATIGTAVAFASILVYSQREALIGGTGLQYARPLMQVFQWQSLRTTLKQRSEANLVVDRLPGELLARVQDRTVTIFPWEASYAAANQLSYRPFPIFQSYDAYTQFLDGWNAEFLDNSTTGPEFVIFDWAAIDGRHPLLDVPQTALALYRHYQLEGTFGAHLLLRRLPEPRFSKQFRQTQNGTIRVGEKLSLPAGSGASSVKLHLKWNFEGSLKKFFWRLPELRWIATLGDGSTVSARIPPAVLAGGVVVDFIPANVDRMRELYTGGPGQRVESVVVAGEGAKYLREDVRYEVASLEGVPVRPVLAPDIKVAPGLRGDCKIDFVDDTSVERGVVSASMEKGFVVVKGWALSASDVLVRIGGRLRRAKIRLARPDVVAAYRQDVQSRPGFELTLPVVELSGSRHIIEVLTRNTTGDYQLCIDTARLELH
jgi:hypothetical protein